MAECSYQKRAALRAGTRLIALDDSSLKGFFIGVSVVYKPPEGYMGMKTECNVVCLEEVN